MNFSKIQDCLGHFGPFQAFVYFLACIVQLFVGIHMLANVFLLGIPRHRCYVPNCDTNLTIYNETFVNFSIPYVNDESGDGLSSCTMYEPIVGYDFCSPRAFNVHKEIPCTNYVWDHTEFEDTVISDFEIVCKKSGLGVASNSIFMVGILMGSAIFGVVADKFGRKNVMLGASMILLCSSIGTAFAPNLTLFSILRFVTGAAVCGLFQTGYILAIEFIGTSKRLICANVMQIVFAVGELILALVAYFIRKWRVLELAISIPAVFLIGYYWLLPESVRWLISKNKLVKAEETIKKAARWNNKTIPEDLLQSPVYTNATEADEGPIESDGPLNLVKNRQLRNWSINIFFIWIVNSMVYYGLSLSAANLGGNTYGNFAILAAVEIPAVIAATYLLSYCGRRIVLCLIMVLGGIACGSTIFVPQYLNWLVTVLAVLGKSAIAASFAIIYIYTAEIYPTTLRSTGLGFSSMFARLGGIVAPIISGLKKVYHPLPMLIFSIATIISGILALWLPETHNRQLPETIEEAESLSSSLGYGFNRLVHRPRHLGDLGSASPRNLRRNDELRRLLDPVA